MVVKAEKIPHGGETVLGDSFIMVPGGKGANQAVCAAKLGADVTFIAKIGSDVFGEMSLENFRKVGIDTNYVSKDPSTPSGVALITVDHQAENAIVVAPGANGTLSPEDVDRAKDVIASADAVLLQFEIPMETVAHTINLANSLGKRVVLNPAPIRPFPSDVLCKADVLVPNQHEAAQLLGKAGTGASLDPESAARQLQELGVDSVVITLGSKGAYIAGEGVSEFIEPITVRAVDTTAAGDAFTASLTLGLAEGLDIVSAARFAAKVAAISVTRMGAQSSLPTREEVESDTFGAIRASE
ncbi:MAG: ribokinase [Chloroflexi bacterium]|nr:ribokinase [Chloroflexota bacterium]